MKKSLVWIFAVVLVLGMCQVGLAKSWWQTGPDTGTTTKTEMEMSETNQDRLLKDVPIPQIEYSQERRNLVRRLEIFNTPDKISYIYLISFGKVMGFHVVKGKVSSVNSLLTTPVQIFDDPNGSREAGSVIVDSPQLDGSYGTNGDAIFFFTTEGVYVEWRGDYMLCDQPLQMATPPELVYAKQVE